MARVRENVELLTDLSRRPAVIIGDHDVRRGSVRAEKRDRESKGAHGDEETKERDGGAGGGG